MVQRTVDLIRPFGRKQKVEFSLVNGDDAVVKAAVDAEQIQQVLMNILTNAVQAMPQGGSVEMTIIREHTRPPAGHEGAEGDYLCIAIQDEGQGISEEDRRHIFEPFFTTKDTGQGTGLGLSIAYGIVREHKGWIDVQSEVGKGSCFRIYLPEDE
jgi:signal transduction histidine kinase